MGSSSSTTSTTNTSTMGHSNLSPFPGDMGRKFMKDLVRQSRNTLGSFNTFSGARGYPNTNYWVQGMLAPLAENMISMEGMGQGQDFLKNYEAELNKVEPVLNQGLANLGTAGDVYGDVRSNLNPIAEGGNLDQSTNPQLQSLLGTIDSRVRNDVGGQFAAGGRSFSGAHANALGSGMAAGEAQPLFTDYWNRQQQMMQANQMLGQVGQSYEGLGQDYGNFGGLFGNLGAAYGDLGNAYDAMQLNRYNVGMQGIGVLSDLFTLPYQKLASAAGVALPISSTFGTNQWKESQRQVQNSNTSTSGFSDRRLKDDIAQVGALFDGTPVYRYSRNGEYQIGLMADEVAPEAVSDGIYGFKMVDYKIATDKAAGV